MTPHALRSAPRGSAPAALVLAFALAGPAAAQEIRASAPLPIADGPLHEYPHIAAAPDGTLWITWMALEGSEEVVWLRPFRGGALGEPVQVARGAMAYRPRVAAAPDGTVWVAWTGGPPERPTVRARAFRDGAPGAVLTVDGGGEGWHPALAVDARGTVWVAWEERAGSVWRVMAGALSGDDVVRAPFAVASGDANRMRPALLADDDGVWLAYDEYRGGYDYDVALRRLDRDEPAVRLTSGPALEQAPALAAARGPGVWVAWHSNRGDDGAPGVARWIELRRWDGTRLHEPPPMPDRDLAARESIQSFEFPTLLADGARVWVLGRPSQGFYAQVLEGERWTRLTSFGVDGWGGRGQLATPVRGPDGAVWTVRRDIGAALLQRLELADAATAARGEEGGRLDVARSDVEADPAHGPGAPPHAHGTGPGQHTHAAPRPPTGEATAAGGSGVEVEGYRLFFGDIHQHSSLSDGMGTVEDTYTRSRDRYGLDFAALADHEWFVRNRLLPSEWAYIRAVNASFHAPGRFVSIPAYEWTGPRYPIGPGHKNVYFPDEGHPIYSLTDTLFDQTPELFEAVKAAGAVAVPHHIGWTGVDWEHHDPVAQPAVEIVSVHGAFEHMGNDPIVHRGGTPGMFVQDGLARGLRFGLLGSSDGHGLEWHHGVGRKQDPWTQGLTGVWAAELTRAALMDALRARRIYATSGAPIRVWLEARGPGDARAEMGGELTVAGAPTLESRVVGTARVRYVHLLRDNEVLHSSGGDADGGRYGSFTFVDEAAAPGTHWYYLRVVQEDGEVAWSSPIWVTVAARAP